MSKPLAILGASGHGKVVADAALEAGWPAVAFYDDAWPNARPAERWPVEGNFEHLVRSLGMLGGAVVGIGDNTVRLKKLDELARLDVDIVSIVHPGARISRFADIGPGSVVFVGAAINVDTRIGRGAIINTGATVDHDCTLGDAVHISPGAHLAGNVTVGDRTWIGIGAAVKQGVRIGRDTTIGAGAVVLRDVPDGVVVTGVPGRVRG